MNSVVTFLLILTAIALQSISVQAKIAGELIGPAPAPDADFITKITQSAAKCTAAATNLNKCKEKGALIPEKCKSKQEVAQKTCKGTNCAAGITKEVREEAEKIANDTADECQKATKACTDPCAAAQKQLASCKDDEAKTKGIEGSKGMKEYCEREGNKRVQAAREEAQNQGGAKDDAKKNGDENKGEDKGGGGGQPPPPPQPPKPEDKPKEDPKKADSKCKTDGSNAGTPECPATAACTAAGGAMSPACQIGAGVNPIISNPAKGNPVLKASDAEDSVLAPDVTGP